MPAAPWPSCQSALLLSFEQTAAKRPPNRVLTRSFFFSLFCPFLQLWIDFDLKLRLNCAQSIAQKTHLSCSPTPCEGSLLHIPRIVDVKSRLHSQPCPCGGSECN